MRYIVSKESKKREKANYYHVLGLSRLLTEALTLTWSSSPGSSRK